MEGTAAPGQFPSSQGSVISEGVGELMVEPGSWGHRFVDLGQVRLLALPGTARDM